ncbi:MAG: biopolymer transporter ExbB [Rhodobacteraceae bacterium]|nr:biopolymer transporter ExbB [Paracoccaceae bacterium]
MKSAEGMEHGQFAMPVQQVTVMVAVLALVLAGSFMAFGFVEPIFLANRYLNGVILGVFFVGILACFWQVLQIAVSVIWFERFLEGSRDDSNAVSKAPRLLAPLAGMLGSHGVKKQISTNSARSILESVASRMDEARDNSRYLSNLLIFLGLLGTFYGLAITVPAVVDTIRSLAPSEGESSIQVFSRLMDGLERQLAGMGTAFSSSLLGLAGSLVVGLLDLFAGQAQNRFYRQLEEWLSGITRVGFGQTLGDAEGSEPSISATAVAGLMEHISELHRILEESEIERSQLVANINSLNTTLGGLAERMDAQISIQQRQIDEGIGTSQLINEMAGQQKLMSDELAKVAVELALPEARLHLRNIDAMLCRMSEENRDSRQDMVEQMRAEMNELISAVRNLNDPYQDPSANNSGRLPPQTDEA